MAVVGGYSLHLYCDTGGDAFGETCPHQKGYKSLRHNAEFMGRNEREAMKEARKAGWKFAEGNQLAYCPNCVKDKRRA